MPGNYDKTKTPPERRRAPKGSTVGLFPSGRHTVQSFQHFSALQAQLGVNAAGTIREALKRAVHVEPLRTVALKAGDFITGDYEAGWHLWECPTRKDGDRRRCRAECSAVRLALQELGALDKP